jgi:hypothetical protein
MSLHLALALVVSTSGVQDLVAPSEGPESGFELKLRSDNPDVALERQIGSYVWSYERHGRTHHVHKDLWEPVCRVPCQTWLHYGETYRLAGNDVVPLTLDSSQAEALGRLDVKAASVAARTSGSCLTWGGAIGLTMAGVLLAILAPNANARCYGANCASNEPGALWFTAGLGALSVASMGTGIALWTANAETQTGGAPQ